MLRVIGPMGPVRVGMFGAPFGSGFGDLFLQSLVSTLRLTGACQNCRTSLDSLRSALLLSKPYTSLGRFLGMYLPSRYLTLNGHHQKAALSPLCAIATRKIDLPGCDFLTIAALNLGACQGHHLVLGLQIDDLSNYVKILRVLFIARNNYIYMLVILEAPHSTLGSLGTSFRAARHDLWAHSPRIIPKDSEDEKSDEPGIMVTVSWLPVAL